MSQTRQPQCLPALHSLHRRRLESHTCRKMSTGPVQGQFPISTFILKLPRLELSSLCLRSEELIGYFATVEVRTDKWMFGGKIIAYSQIFKQIAIFYGFI